MSQNFPIRRFMLGLPLLILMLLAFSARTTTLTAAASTLATAAPTASPTDHKELTMWKVVDPANPNRPTLFVSDGATFRLTPTWQVERAESLYLWSSERTEKSLYSHQTIESHENSYRRGTEEVSSQLVASLVSGMSNLYPTHSIVAGMRHDPGGLLWSVDLIGKDGQRILIYSMSTVRQDGSPWNIYYNGRIYAQYNDTLGPILEKLFPSERYPWIPVETLSQKPSGLEDKNRLVFASEGQPPQLSQGFVGLSPIAYNFDVKVERGANTFTGKVSETRGYSYPYFPDTTITDVQAVELLTDPSHPVPCPIELTTQEEPKSKFWNFKCPLSAAATGDSYDYPIRVTLSNPNEQKFQTEGQIVGKFVDKDAQIRIPTLDLEQMLAGDPDVADLLTDHVLLSGEYNTWIQRDQLHYDEVGGEVTLLGETKVGTTPVRYQIETPFQITGGKLAHWTLTRAELDRMLNIITQMPLTKRVVGAKPDLVLELEYKGNETQIETVDYFEISNNNYHYSYFDENFVPCGTSELLWLPNDRDPYAAFSFTASIWRFSPDFVIVNNQPVVARLEILPPDEDPIGLLRPLFRPPMKTANGKTFHRIKASEEDYESLVVLEVLKSEDADTRAALHKLAEALPGTLLEGDKLPRISTYDEKFVDYWVLQNAAIAPTADGMLEIIGCKSMKPTPTAIPPTSTPNPTPAKTTEPLDPSKLVVWSLYDPVDPNRPALITKNGNAFRLKPDWEPSRIDYLYTWIGLSPTSVFDYQVLESNANGYQIGTQKIDAALVTKLIAAISNLQPVSGYASGIDHTDDYPHWHLDLTGKDGEHIELYSDSTANPGAAPWNVIYNGRVYTHLDATLGAAIGELFKSERGMPAASFFPGGREPGTIIYSAGGGMHSGGSYVGLVPVASSFYYEIDAKSTQIEGHIRKPYAISNLGHLVTGTVSKLVNAELLPAGKPAISCTNSTKTNSNPNNDEWVFTCPLAAAPINTFYDFPIKMTFGTDTDQQVSVEGRLQGKFVGTGAMAYTPPLEVRQALLAGSADAADILSDHALGYVSYSAVVDSASSTLKQMSGQAVLLGQTEVGKLSIRYTVSTPFVIQNGKVTYWTLKRAALEKMLAQVIVLPITQRVYANLPEATLNLTYAENGQLASIGSPMGSQAVAPQTHVTSCNLSSPVDLPQSEPLRQFGFSNNGYDGRTEFLLIKDQVIVNLLDLSPITDQSNPLFSLLVPRQFDADTQKALERIYFNDGFRDAQVLTLNPNKTATAESIAALRKFVTTLPGTVDYKYETIWEISGLTLHFTPEGVLEVAACPAK